MNGKEEESKRSLLCNRELDAMFFCASIRNQARALYRDGEFDSCSDTYAAWMACIRGKPEDSREIKKDLSADVWELKEIPRWNYKSDAPDPPSSVPSSPLSPR